MKLKLFLLIFLLWACDKDDKPKELIAEDKMAAALTDIHILESYVNDLHLGNGDSSLVVYQKMKVDTLKKFGLDSSNFNRSLKYYIMNPNLLKNIYTEVKKNLEAKKKKITDLDAKKNKILANKQKTIQKRIIDSLKLKTIPNFKSDSVRKKLIKMHKPMKIGVV
jgi:Domain of unknown function (DUF4296)